MRIQHQAVNVNVLERHAPREMLGHHNHPRNPEENDVVTRYQHGAGQV